MAVNIYPIRFWIVDNSLSMQTRDSHRLVGQLVGGGANENIGMVDCTRWEEVGEGVGVHAEIAGRMLFPCRFTMLNAPYHGSASFSVGERGPAAAPAEVLEVKNTVTRSAPTGATPLTQHVNDIYNMVAPMAPALTREGRRVAVIVATDGMPSDAMGNEGHIILQQFVESLRRLETLPVSVVIRLATDDEAVVDFYNSIDKQVGNLPYDVLDDFYGEALEVYLRNPWLTYALSLHRFRELGVYVPAIDHLDTQALTTKELYDFCSGIFAGPPALPDPATNWPAFIDTLSGLQVREQQHFNPVTKRVSPWIDLGLLNALYGRGYQLPAHIRQQLQQPVQQARPRQQQPAPVFASQGYRQPPQTQQGQGRPGQFQQAAFARPTQQQQYPQQHAQSPAARPPHQPPQPSGQHPAAAPPRTQAPPPPSAKPPQPSHAPSHDGNASGGGGGGDAIGGGSNAALKRGILTQWALRPPNFQALKPIGELLCSVQGTFPPAHGVKPHDYFGKWKPFAPSAFVTGDAAVLKRAMRKMKFFLHPDKLPRDLTPDQSFVCTTLWHVLNDAMDESSRS